MPPLGNFAPPSVGKDSKKRKAGAGLQITGGSVTIDIGPGAGGQNNKNGNLRVVNTNKVSSAESEFQKKIFLLSLNSFAFFFFVAGSSPNKHQSNGFLIRPRLRH